MTDTTPTAESPASEPAAPAVQPAPASAARERRPWPTALVASLVVAAALVLGGAGGFALAVATRAGGPPSIELREARGPGLPGNPGMAPRHDAGPRGDLGPRRSTEG